MIKLKEGQCVKYWPLIELDTDVHVCSHDNLNILYQYIIVHVLLQYGSFFT